MPHRSEGQKKYSGFVTRYDTTRKWCDPRRHGTIPASRDQGGPVGRLDQRPSAGNKIWIREFYLMTQRIGYAFMTAAALAAFTLPGTASAAGKMTLYCSPQIEWCQLVVKEFE